MEITGTVKMIGQPQQVSSSFRKREIVITTEEQYPQHILVEFNQDKCDLLNGFHIGEAVRIGINLRGREWTNPQGETKYFNSIQGWKIERQNTQAPQQNGGSSAVDNYLNNQNPNFNQSPNNQQPGQAFGYPQGNNQPKNHQGNFGSQEEPDDLPF